MRKAFGVFAALALTAGCAAGGGNNSPTTAPPVTRNPQSRVSMSFTPAASAKKVIVTVDGVQSVPLLIAHQAQTTTLADNVAVSVDCQTVSSGSSATGSTSAPAQICTLLTLLPAGQHDISVAQMDFLNSLIADLDSLVTLANGNAFFGNFFNASSTPSLPSTSPS